MARLTIVRHGESVANAQHRIQGHQCAGLTETGLAQADACAAWLAVRRPAVRRVLVSDLGRAVQTATPIVAALGAALEIDEVWRERSCGSFEGLRADELDQVDPAVAARYRAGEDVFGEVGGESPQQLLDRVVPRFEALLDGDEDVIVVTHGGPTWFGTQTLLGIERGTLGRPGNAAITELSRDPGGPTRLRAWNERGHLASLTTPTHAVP
ncbi:MAG: histidine phosphatase family protein [Nitriliruptoraceae bacterium]|nr:histidine phosphatase family protein [Nitriliruptoraceae bacterium]